MHFLYGNGGVCFTYGTCFALGGLPAVRKAHENCPAVRKGVKFLPETQLVDGGRGESYKSCLGKITDGKAVVLFEGANWAPLITFKIDELERLEKGRSGGK
ncbi:hypothetical protein L1987_03944 [Smallanthus sonchifolius]|uniref:Uncharacterized protein n=1 Tax=Smallanthus sonchifolius TaxID=185202 RepID=A0ACB9KBX6_9ASTR|nr:hypothetical protein L1987_03944 [Smallanthus sonchifolius]